MTKAEWLACTDLSRMLESLRGKASDRRLRLSAYAAAVELLGELEDEERRRKIEPVERFAGNADLNRTPLLVLRAVLLQPGFALRSKPGHPADADHRYLFDAACKSWKMTPD
jgi:hypothetical protein